MCEGELQSCQQTDHAPNHRVRPPAEACGCVNSDAAEQVADLARNQHIDSQRTAALQAPPIRLRVNEHSEAGDRHECSDEEYPPQ